MPVGSGAFVGARVLPMTTDEAEASAVLWEQGRVRLVGDDQEVRAEAARRGIEAQDLEGRLVLPGFVDAHMHFLHVGLRRTRPDLAGAASLEEALDLTASWLADHPGHDPVTAEGWDESAWPAGTWPTRADLDRIEAQRPLVLRRMCGHVAIANTAALGAVRQRWDDPALVDPETGVLLEQPSLFLNEVLREGPEGLAAAVEVACAAALRIGVTTVGTYEQEPMGQALHDAARTGRLGVRVVRHMYPQELEAALAAGFRTGAEVVPGRLWHGGLKMFLDGSIGGHSALLLEPYTDRPDTQGLQNFTDAEVDAYLAKAHDAGVQVHAHAIGDGAVAQGLAAYARLAQRVAGDAGSEAPLDGLRHRFEHYELVHPEQARRTAQLGVTACVQPNFVGAWSGQGGLYEQRLGPRFRINNRFVDHLTAGVRLAFGSDGMPFGPLEGIAAALEHPRPDQRLGLATALGLYTREAARALHLDHLVGTLAPGRAADMLVLDDDADSPRDWILRQTVLDGQVVHEGDAALPHD